MGYRVNGVCYSDSAEAYSVFVGQFPTMPDLVSGDYWVYDGGSVSGFGVVDGYVSNGTFGQVHMVFQMAECVSSVSVFDPATFAAFWAGALFFTWGCWLVSKNAGVVLSAIRRL